ncbi:MAG TPA: hypothetical protein VK689_04590 [Armatimonadota bacterium]|nr:hypothetical protein [Armatimonadota bacterium]
MQIFIDTLRRHRAEQERRQLRLRRTYWESERLRAELSHLGHVIYEIQGSKLSTRQKGILETTIRVRCRRVEEEMLDRQYQIAASGHVPDLW